MSDTGAGAPRNGIGAGTHLYRAGLMLALSLIAWGGNKYFDRLTVQMDRVEQSIAGQGGTLDRLTSRQQVLWDRSIAHDAMLTDHEHRLTVLEISSKRGERP